MTTDSNTFDESDYQTQLNQATLSIFEEKGAANHLRAQFTKLLITNILIFKFKLPIFNRIVRVKKKTNM